MSKPIHHCKFVTDLYDEIESTYAHTTRCEIWNTVYGGVWLIVDNCVQEVVERYIDNAKN